MLRFALPLFLAAISATPALPAAAPADPLDAYNVVWTTPSENSSGSMPLGNGEVGVNLWVERDGDLLFFISRTDAWDEHARLVKLGRVRVRLTPNPFRSGTPFRQELKLRQGEAVIDAGEMSLRLWVDAARPVIRLEAKGKQPFSMEAVVEIWRTDKRPLDPGEVNGVDLFAENEPPLVYPDTVAEAQGDAVMWYHRDTASLFPATLKLQALEKLIPEFPDPLMNRTFGALIRGSGLKKAGPTMLKSASPSDRFVLTIATLTAQTETAEAWVRRIEEAADQATAVPLEEARREHHRWWDVFWGRSWMRVTGGDAAETSDLSTGWHLNRYQNACAGRGRYPLKFNGSIFNVDGKHLHERNYAGGKIPASSSYSGDFREWGGCYWFQNTRHMFWPMLAAGDFDMMMPLFRMYRDMLPFSERRTRIYYGHEGAFFPETLHFWGAYFNSRSFGYGWELAGKPPGRILNGFTRYYWQGGLELLAMMLDYHSMTGDAAFARETLLPFAEAVTTFYDQHYRRDGRGKIRFEPANALETFWDVVDPTPEIAGLDRTLKGMLALPENLAPARSRERWGRMLRELPPYPIKERDGKRYLDAAETIRDQPHNGENVALWAVFPYRIFGVGRPDLDMIRTTFKKRPYSRGYSCWGNDNTSAAYVGLASEARKHLAERFVRHGNYRFPVTYAPGDWPPDIDNGGNAQQALQAMLMQADGRQILLFPAWPREWDVEFKLHAPLGTTLEGVYRGGKLVSLKVTPDARRPDVTQLAPQ